MSKDPAYLFYDGDAAKDVSHMNRLERGGYFDLLQAQRKFGHMTIDVIKKVLGNDFNAVWDSIKIVLTYVDDMYCIQWLDESVIKRKNYCKSRSENRKHGKINKIKKEHMSNICKSYVEHMEDENEDDNINVIDNDNSSLKTKRGKIFIKPTLNEVAEYIQENKYTVNPEKWYSYYESNGWKIGKNSMKNWQACVRTWQHNNLDNVKKIGLVD